VQSTSRSKFNYVFWDGYIDKERIGSFKYQFFNFELIFIYLDNNAALVANIANGVISVLATCLGIWLLGRIGRRPMLLSGQIGTIVMHLFIGTTALLFKEGTIR